MDAPTQNALMALPEHRRDGCFDSNLTERIINRWWWEGKRVELSGGLITVVDVQGLPRMTFDEAELSSW